MSVSSTQALSSFYLRIQAVMQISAAIPIQEAADWHLQALLEQVHEQLWNQSASASNAPVALVASTYMLYTVCQLWMAGIPISALSSRTSSGGNGR